MKNPLTSKERRGLAAVAAAALLCISSGFIFRSCSSYNRYRDNNSYKIISENDSIDGDKDSISTDRSLPLKNADKRKKKKKKKSNSSEKKKTGNSSQKKKAEKVYPTRDPLSQPCD